jgi:hypothetical protein
MTRPSVHFWKGTGAVWYDFEPEAMNAGIWRLPRESLGTQ